MRMRKVSFGPLLSVIYSVVSNDSVRPWSDCADAQAGLGLCYPRRRGFARRGPYGNNISLIRDYSVRRHNLQIPINSLKGWWRFYADEQTALRLCCPYTRKSVSHDNVTGLGCSVGCVSDWSSWGRGFDPCQVRQFSSVEIDHEMSSTVILSCWFKRGSCQFLRKKMEKYWLTA